MIEISEKELEAFQDLEAACNEICTDCGTPWQIHESLVNALVNLEEERKCQTAKDS